jgi:hypothetical protein
MAETMGEMRPSVALGVSGEVDDVAETSPGKIVCTCCAMKPTCVLEAPEESTQLKVTGLSESMAQIDEDATRLCVLVRSGAVF